MKTIARSSVGRFTRPYAALPDDLSQLCPVTDLVRHVLEAVNTFFWAGATGETTFLSRAFNPRVMLTVVTYSYATGRYSSDGVARACEEDATLRYLGLGVRPAPNRIRVFRGQNIELVRRCLAHVIEEVCSDRVPFDQGSREMNELEARGFAREAERRIGLALSLG